MSEQKEKLITVTITKDGKVIGKCASVAVAIAALDHTATYFADPEIDEVIQLASSINILLHNFSDDISKSLHLPPWALKAMLEEKRKSTLSVAIEKKI